MRKLAAPAVQLAARLVRLVEPVVRLVVPVVPIAGAGPQGSEQVVVQLVPPEQLALLRQLLAGLAGRPPVRIPEPVCYPDFVKPVVRPVVLVVKPAAPPEQLELHSVVLVEHFELPLGQWDYQSFVVRLAEPVEPIAELVVLLAELVVTLAGLVGLPLGQ